MFGTAGGLLDYRAAQLASRGIASLALAFFRYEDLPKYLDELHISYFEEAVGFLLKHDKVITGIMICMYLPFRGTGLDCGFILTFDA